MDKKIKTISQIEHIRLRASMYIGRLSDGSHPEDGIYTILREVINNSVDEYHLGYGGRIEVKVDDFGDASVRDYGRGIPHDRLLRLATTPNPDGMFADCNVSYGFDKKCVSLHGFGLSVTNALSKRFCITSFRDGVCSWAKFSCGKLTDEGKGKSDEADGTLVEFSPDETIFIGYQFQKRYVFDMVYEYACLNGGLEMILNGDSMVFKNGLADRLMRIIGSGALYEPVHLIGDDVEIAFTHIKSDYARIDSYVNWHYTRDGGTHMNALKLALKTIFNEVTQEPHDLKYYSDGLVCVFNVVLASPYFLDSRNIALGSRYTWESQDGNGKASHGPTIRMFLQGFLRKELTPYLKKHNEIIRIIEKAHIK